MNHKQQTTTNQQPTTKLIIFTRYPEAGKTKTRLIPALGKDGAAQLQQEMTEHSLRQVTPLLTQPSLQVEIQFAGGNKGLMEDWLGANWCYTPQTEGDLGQKLETAFAQAFAQGIERVVIMGIDCPDLSADLLNQAFEQLKTVDLVLGEAEDGGYYLIGLRRMIPGLFTGVAWGTSTVFATTLEKAKTEGCDYATLPVLNDIDYPEDLPLWETKAKEASARN
ncbi:TIGR04282 family arsenosugar biosynthesis glycosyltransferase [Spirulina sp. CS-785/01]|uniref:TIGR04282 family arsenosugar biosynthesis glycosyltransferase n=1 Tax=Spirulina sp. CS-785/01 TaxID=3021716 RepID=UPI0023308CE1|nr:TIGR04282 family arsenosugar biosynthesis glycosyltransferase [Spirulina sp. CS-785/01]MDB9313000.1 TIGR04282 family arsenosugar biosynthesis glycosyltransferase [Spirulina sp. CS-785/01]